MFGVYYAAYYICKTKQTNMSKKITATCEILDRNTDKVISKRIIGEFDTVDAASFAAHKERKDNETVCIYNTPVQDEENMSALEMAEIEVAWEEYAKL